MDQVGGDTQYGRTLKSKGKYQGTLLVDGPSKKQTGHYPVFLLSAL